MPLSLALDVFGVMYMTLSKTYFVKAIRAGILTYFLEEIVSWQHKSWRKWGHKSQMGAGIVSKACSGESLTGLFLCRETWLNMRTEYWWLHALCLSNIDVCRAGGLMRAPLTVCHPGKVNRNTQHLDLTNTFGMSWPLKRWICCTTLSVWKVTFSELYSS